MHERCMYPRCNCIRHGKKCQVADAADRPKCCSHCGLGENDLHLCMDWDVCSNGGAVMVDPVDRAVLHFAKQEAP